MATDEKFRQLAELGAGEFEHLDGTLIEHLRGTQRLLQQWGAPTALQDAGLYHAAYGTAGFEARLVSMDQRHRIAAIIGREAEELVYQYCACDRKVFFAKIGQETNPAFNNRFTGEAYRLSPDMLANFCELTAANEVEIALGNPEFIAEHGAGLHQLFTQMTPYLSAAAQAEAAEFFGGR